MENSVETWINRLKEKKNFLASGLNLVKPADILDQFSFEDLADLFMTHVTFTGDDEPKKAKLVETPVEKPIDFRKKFKKAPRVRKGKGFRPKKLEVLPGIRE